jgi:hypothetical protein
MAVFASKVIPHSSAHPYKSRQRHYSRALCRSQHSQYLHTFSSQSRSRSYPLAVVHFRHSTSVQARAQGRELVRDNKVNLYSSHSRNMPYKNSRVVVKYYYLNTSPKVAQVPGLENRARMKGGAQLHSTAEQSRRKRTINRFNRHMHKRKSVACGSPDQLRTDANNSADMFEGTTVLHNSGSSFHDFVNGMTCTNYVYCCNNSPARVEYFDWLEENCQLFNPFGTFLDGSHAGLVPSAGCFDVADEEDLVTSSVKLECCGPSSLQAPTLGTCLLAGQ